MKIQSFNNDWRIWRDNNPFELVFKVPEDAILADLPYDAMLHEAQSADSVNGGNTGHLDGGVYKYYKSFYVDEKSSDENIYLRFEGIYKDASIFINQSLAGQRACGYIDFKVKINDYLRFGQMNDILVVSRSSAMKNSRWYSGSGIYRNTWMYTAGKIYLPPNGLRMTAMDIDPDGALIQIEAKMINDEIHAKEVDAKITVADASGEVILDQSYPVRIKGHDCVNFRKNVYVDNAVLWSDENPYLYTIKVDLKSGDECLDSDEIVTGIRKISVDARHGLRVNGKTVKLRGACIHHDQGLLGAATYDDFEYRRIKLLKDAGYNAVRSAHNPASQALLKACDMLGVYVMDELTDAWNKSKSHYDYSVDFERDWEMDVEAMVEADYNHPSVIMYSTGNEIFEICTDKGFESSRMLGDKFHELDPGRFTTNGINGAFAAGDGLAQIVKDITGNDVGKGDVNVFMGALENHMPEIGCHDIISEILEKLDSTMDVIGYNYMTARYVKDAAVYPDRIMVGTETYPKQIAQNWDAIMQTPAAIGDFTWTGWDYMGEVAPVYPALINFSGDIDIIGRRRPVSYYREIVFGLKKGPVIAVQNPKSFGIPRNFGPWCYTDCTFNYNYPGLEKQPIMIQVYGGGDSVELLVNGKSLGVQPCGKATAFETQFNTVYEPGELLAIAYENGVEIGRNMLKTTKPASIIYAEADYENAYGKEQALAFINISLLDKEGLLVADASNALSVEIEGHASLAAFGSLGAVHQHGFEAATAVAAGGYALAILKVDNDGSKIRVTITGEGLESAIIEI